MGFDEKARGGDDDEQAQDQGSPAAAAAAVAVATAVFTISALPAFSADNSTVAVKIMAVNAQACLTVSPTTEIDLGQTTFSTAPTANFVSLPTITVANCGNVSEFVAVKGTHATGTGPSPGFWTLTDSQSWTLCQSFSDRNTYGISLGADLKPYLTTTDQFVTDISSNKKPFAAGSTTPFNGGIKVPCSGSGGAGQSMSFQVVFTASL
jgi:hypothetical protein